MPLILCDERLSKCGKASTSMMIESLKIILNLIPPGMVTTYKAVGEALGVNPRVAGRLLALNDEPVIVPCHRVVRSNGDLGGYSGPGGVRFKRMLLEAEGVKFCSGKVCREHILRRLPVP
ncbi:MAG: MGMT family protein [Desulfurococcales archaeon]|nr:MGMT family protein [Desulfurococcales archaeon]